MSSSLSAAPEASRSGSAAAQQTPRPARTSAPLHVGQVVCWQVAGALGLATIGASTLRATILAIAAVMLVAGTTLRRHGRWAYQWAWLWLTLSYRARVCATTGQHDSAETALLAHIDRASTISEVTIDDTPVAVVEHAGGLTAVLELGTSDRPLGLEPATLPSPADLLPPDDAETTARRLAAAQPGGVTIQLVTQVTPAPSPTWGNSLAAVSYRQLTGGRVPGRHHAWLAVQILRTPEALPTELRQALSSVVRRLLRRLRRDLVAVRALDAAGLRATLTTASHLDLANPLDGNGVIGVERWSGWWTRDVPQASFHVNHWSGLSGTPDAGMPDAELVHRLLGIECLAVTVSLAARRTAARRTEEERVAVQLTARLAAPDASSLAATIRQLQERLDTAGAVAERLDGRHVYGLAATLPLGGFLL